MIDGRKLVAVQFAIGPTGTVQHYNIQNTLSMILDRLPRLGQDLVQSPQQSQHNANLRSNPREKAAIRGDHPEGCMQHGIDQ